MRCFYTAVLLALSGVVAAQSQAPGHDPSTNPFVPAEQPSMRDSVQSSGSASWPITFNGPVEYYRGVYYYANNLQISGSAPGFGSSTSSIYQVNWNFKGYSPLVSGQHAVLCAQNISCFTLPDGVLQGSTTAFNGLPANTIFFVRFYVDGSGQLSPFVDTGYDNQLFISYSY